MLNTEQITRVSIRGKYSLSLNGADNQVLFLSLDTDKKLFGADSYYQYFTVTDTSTTQLFIRSAHVIKHIPPLVSRMVWCKHGLATK
jgi:hypothetical protein